MTTPAAVVDVEGLIIDALANMVAAQFDPATFAVAAGALNPTPDSGAALTLTLVQDDARQALRRYALQVRTRGGADPREVGRIAETITAQLHGASALLAGPVVIAHIWRLSSVGMGRDSDRRWQRSDNFLLDVSTGPTTWIEP